MRYIGCKNQLLSKISKVIDENVTDAKIFCDIFSGTGVVGEFFKDKYTIISNDFLYFSYIIQKAKIESTKYPDFYKLKEVIGDDPIDYLNSDSLEKNKFNSADFFIKNNYSDFGGRNYLLSTNAEKIDKWRILINKWKTDDLINQNEYCYLVACVVETVPFYSNISGTFGAFLKTWDKRALKEIKLIRLDVQNGSTENKCYNEDSDELIKKIHGDILYMDPPYNERQYLPNYHVLETVARYDYPKLHGTTGLREYSKQKSKWCLKKTVAVQFENMIKNADFKHIMLSYNTDGLMSIDTITSIMNKYSCTGETKIYKIPFTRFKSRELTNTSDLSELIFYIRKK